MTCDAVLLVVVFVDRSNPEFEVIHIISARKVVSFQEQVYEEQIG
jgi:uncharacterized DUF497 family protein